MGGTRHGNVFWEEEKSNVGLRMMQSMGWEHGKGLGSRGHGMTTHIRVRQKKDNAGIGANAATADDAWKATQDVFNSILSRLNDTDAVAAVEKELKEDKAKSTPTVKQTMVRHQLYRKFRTAKNASEYSATDMAMIFGRRADVKPEVAPPSGSAVDSGHQTTVSTVCMRTYFQMRMRGVHGGGEPAAVERVGGSNGFTEDFQVQFAQEMTKRSESYTGRQGLGFASSGARAGTGGEYSVPTAPQDAPREEPRALVQTPPTSDTDPAAGGKRKSSDMEGGSKARKAGKVAKGAGGAAEPKLNLKRALRAVMRESGAAGMKLKHCRAKLVAHFGGGVSADAVEQLLARKAAKAGFEIVGKRIRRRADVDAEK